MSRNTCTHLYLHVHAHVSIHVLMCACLLVHVHTQNHVYTCSHVIGSHVNCLRTHMLTHMYMCRHTSLGHSCPLFLLPGATLGLWSRNTQSWPAGPFPLWGSRRTCPLPPERLQLGPSFSSLIYFMEDLVSKRTAFPGYVLHHFLGLLLLTRKERKPLLNTSK